MKITIRNFQKKIPVHPTRIKKTILKVFSGEKRKTSGEITICFVNDAKIRQLNKRFHRSDTPTDVLTFDISEPQKHNELIADILVSADTAARNAKIYRTTPAYELNLYVIHGLLHLLGYDDRSARQIRLMRKKEKEYADT